MSKHEWPTAPIIEATYVCVRDSGGCDWVTESIAIRGLWAKDTKGLGYYCELEPHCAECAKEVSSKDGYFTNVTEYWPKTDPAVYALPPEPEGPVWDKEGRKWEKSSDFWWERGADRLRASWLSVLYNGPVTTIPPAREWNVGDTISQGDDLRALPTGAILKAEHKTMAGKIVHKIGSCELEVTGIRGSTYPACIQYPLTIIHLPEEGE